MVVGSGAWLGGRGKKHSLNLAIKWNLRLNQPSPKQKIAPVSFKTATAPAATLKTSDVVADSGKTLSPTLYFKTGDIAFTGFGNW